MTPKPKATQRRLIKKYNIHFDGPAEFPFRCPAAWPATRGTLVTHIQRLGQTQYHQYQESISCDSLHRPWREEVRRRAKNIVNLSQKCLDERRNELGWRFTVEVEVMARWTIEVACKQCRGRLWRSEQEIDPGDITTAGEAARRLRQRQLNREPCGCDLNEPQNDADDSESGINPLFDCLLDEAIAYAPELQIEMSKRKEKPDRVYGLRSTRRLERILSSTDKRPSASGQCIGDSITTHPFTKDDAEPAHFPFLVLEAKSEKGPDSFSDVASQTAFSIRELLMLQENLRVAAGDGPAWGASPLVWFLSYKGEEWKVCIAYIETKNDYKHFRIVQIWRGALNVRDDALRLLLIIDYIFDWARDMYREGIIRGLRRLQSATRSALTTPSRSLFYQDSDVFSTTDRVKLWAVANDHGDEVGGTEQGATGIRDALRSFDTRHGVIRDIRYIRSRFLGLYITGANLDAFLKTASTEQESKALAASVLTHLLEGWRVKGKTLDALESDWTGKERGQDQGHQETTFLVVAAVAAYLTVDWEQTRELSYIAVEEGVMGRLLNYAGRRLAEGHQLSDLPFVDNDAFSDSLLVLRRQLAWNNLLACISRACLSTGILSTKEYEHRDALSVLSVEKSDEGVISRSDAVLKPDTAIKRDFVRAIYDQYKIGRNEPFCPFMRVSSVLDELGLPEEAPAIHPRGMEVSRWFRRAPQHPELPSHGVVIASSSNPIAGSTAPRLCLFVTDPASVRMSGSQFQELLQAEPPWHFRARRYDKRRGWCKGWNYDPDESIATPFNEGCILYRLKAFMEALKALGAHPSSGQNSQEDQATNEDEQAWAPKKPNSLWDVLLAPGLEFMSDAMVMDAPCAQSIRPTTENDNPRRIRQVNREDTPRESVEPRSKGKQPETILNRAFSHYSGMESDNSTRDMAIRPLHRGESAGQENVGFRGRSNAADGDPGPSCLTRGTRRESPEWETEASLREPKRQCVGLSQTTPSDAAEQRAIEIRRSAESRHFAYKFLCDLQKTALEGAGEVGDDRLLPEFSQTLSVLHEMFGREHDWNSDDKALADDLIKVAVKSFNGTFPQSDSHPSDHRA